MRDSTNKSGKHKPKGPAKPSIDRRERLVNNRQTGPIEQVSLPLNLITSLFGILLDIDPSMLSCCQADPSLQDPRLLFDMVINPMLMRSEVLSRAEVRVSGRGLHVLIWFEQAVEFLSTNDRDRWAANVRLIQRLLPTDPDCPGITALTRPVGSVNGKNGEMVYTLRDGEPVPVAEVLKQAEAITRAPFLSVASVLLGPGPHRPCPVCRREGSKLDILDRLGKCYGHCGKLTLGRIYDTFLLPRTPAVPDGMPKREG